MTFLTTMYEANRQRSAQKESARRAKTVKQALETEAIRSMHCKMLLLRNDSACLARPSAPTLKRSPLMEYCVKTVHGISEDNYRGTVFEPLFCTGQGSGASSAVWLVLSTVLMEAIDRLTSDRMTFVKNYNDS